MDTQPLYQRLADYYRRAIQSGALAPAQRMPSVRTMVRTHHVSLTTALQVCRRLEDDGLVEARPRSGYFVRPPAGPRLAPVPDPDIARPIDTAQYEGIHDRVSRFVTLCESEPCSANFALAAAPPASYPHAALRQSMMRALRMHSEQMVGRAPPQGHPQFRALLARRALDCGINAGADELLVTHGCIEALNLALRAVARPGDTIAVESPTYFGLLQIIESLGMRALEIPTSPQRGISIEALELALRTQPGIRAVVVVPNLQNPLGCIMADEDKQRLLRLCHAQQIALIEDDTYGALADDGPGLAIKHWDRHGDVIYCASLHKTLAPAMRLGWTLGGRWHDRMAMFKFAQSRPNEPMAQIAVADYMATKAYDRHLARLRHQLRQQRLYVADAVARHFPAGTRLAQPPGGMLLWLELPEGTPGMTVFEEALRAGIRVAPGAMFSNSARYDHFLRLSCTEPVGAATDAAVRRLGEIVSACGK
ncbi:2-aminoadipate aminotransferase [Bordetella genomosp. 1]|uniref:2-aminoadipate aminotransferase n=1 Tax=Bordetella genomosp. 1 TaxID=1395607 RepID=A0A261SG81_9BORD|nr:PLP-dependent aminotransferase family protein [Bordetella genomosp. 1]OZI36386.1 2-aminoadipate aminotransferase [Bordetella genomosp. 1]OZI57844.1 2-aminoadipate aminotransferase [Bordetella genomosp. 1]